MLIMNDYYSTEKSLVEGSPSNVKLLTPVNCQNKFTGIFEKVLLTHDLLKRVV